MASNISGPKMYLADIARLLGASSTAGFSTRPLSLNSESSIRSVSGDAIPYFTTSSGLTSWNAIVTLERLFSCVAMRRFRNAPGCFDFMMESPRHTAKGSPSEKFSAKLMA